MEEDTLFYGDVGVRISESSLRYPPVGISETLRGLPQGHMRDFFSNGDPSFFLE